MADNKKFIGFYLSPSQAKKLRSAAKQDNRSVSSYIRALIFSPTVSHTKEPTP